MTGPLRRLWWLSPGGVLLLVVPLSVALAAGTSDQGFRLLYRTPKVLTTGQAWLFLLAGGVLLLGVLAGSAAREPDDERAWPGLSAAQLRTLERAATVCFWTTVLGYAAFALAGLARGLSLAALQAVLTSRDTYSSDLKETFAPVTGITTLTQVGIAYVVVAGLLLVTGRGRRQRRRLAVVVALALLRAFFLNERLALLEVVVPLVALLFLRLRQERPGAVWLPAVPALALPLLVAVFGAFEYSRSWTYFRSRVSTSFPEFVVDRLAGYYATAYNNGAIQLEHVDREGRLPYATIEAFWTAPGVQQVDLYGRLTGRDPVAEYALLLEQHGTPEFNNPGGLSVPLVDLGLVGGLLALLVAGVLVGLCYSSFVSGQPLGLLLYPLVFTGLLELPRYLYWTQGRIVPAVLALLLIVVRLRRVAPRAATGRQPLPLRPLQATA